MAEEEFPPFGGPPIGADSVTGKLAPSPSVEKSANEQFNTLMARVRDIERRFANTQDLLRFHEEESRKSLNHFWTRLKEFEERVVSLSHTVAELDQQVHLIVSELRLTAKKEDFEVLKRFIEYIKPVKFVTVDQVERLVKDILEEEGVIKGKIVEE